MNPERTLNTRLKALSKQGFDPTYVIAVLEFVETTLLEYNSDVVTDKEMPDDAKGRHAMVVNAMLNAVRKAKVEVPSLKVVPEVPKRQLYNSQFA